MPLDEIDEVGAGKPDVWALLEVSKLEIRPEPPALNEKACIGPPCAGSIGSGGKIKICIAIGRRAPYSPDI
jgi:hypothetical protein